MQDGQLGLFLQGTLWKQSSWKDSGVHWVSRAGQRYWVLPPGQQEDPVASHGTNHLQKGAGLSWLHGCPSCLLSCHPDCLLAVQNKHELSNSHIDGAQAPCPQPKVKTVTTRTHQSLGSWVLQVRAWVSNHRPSLMPPGLPRAQDEPHQTAAPRQSRSTQSSSQQPAWVPIPWPPWTGWARAAATVSTGAGVRKAYRWERRIKGEGS
jgi:hypothetical protein